MARLQRGEDPKIDKINDLVAVAINGNSVESNDALTELLKMFKPMMIKVCTKWSNYFNDSAHSIISFGELLADAEYWFVHYTMHKYTINGDATYNKFIKDHIDQRIRYIYECQLRYYKRLVFPDPNRQFVPLLFLIHQVFYPFLLVYIPQALPLEILFSLYH